MLNKATLARAFLEAFAASRLANRWTDRVTSVILRVVGGFFQRGDEKKKEVGRVLDDDLGLCIGRDGGGVDDGGL